MRHLFLFALLSLACGPARPPADPTQHNTNDDDTIVAGKFTHHGETRGRLRLRVEGAAVGAFARELDVTRGTVDDDALSGDELMLLAWLLDRGHVEGTVTHRVEVAANEIAVTFKVTPGPVYHLRSFDVTEPTPAGSQPALGWVAPMKPGDVFSRAALIKALNKMRLTYHDLGYANVEADPQTSVDKEKREVGLTVSVVRNELVSVERVEVVGNKNVTTETIQGKLACRAGDRYSETAILQSKTALLDSGRFTKVDVSASIGGDKTKVIVRFEVQEK